MKYKEDFREAVINFREVLLKELKIKQLVSWLSEKLKRFV